MKKIILPIILIFAMLFSLNAYAVEGKLTANSPTGKVGEQVTLTVRLDNPGIIDTRVFVRYDSKVLKLDNAENGEVYTANQAMFGKDLSANPFTMLWDDSLNPNNNTKSGTLFTLTFTVKAGTASGKTTVSVDVDDASTFDTNLNSVKIAGCKATVNVPTAEGTTTTKPATTKPATTTTKPAVTTKPAATTTKPAATTKPATTTKPAATTTKPAATTKPATTTAKPATTTKAATTTVKATTTTKAATTAKATTTTAPSKTTTMTTVVVSDPTKVADEATTVVTVPELSEVEPATTTFEVVTFAEESTTEEATTSVATESEPVKNAKNPLLLLLLLIPAATIVVVVLLLKKKKNG